MHWLGSGKWLVVGVVGGRVKGGWVSLSKQVMELSLICLLIVV